MRDFCAGNRSGKGYVEKEWRRDGWNPYAGEEEPLCPAGEKQDHNRWNPYAGEEEPLCPAGEKQHHNRWNPYAGEEEPVGGCCGRGRSMEEIRGIGFGKLPDLNEKERRDILRWDGKTAGMPDAGNDYETIIEEEKKTEKDLRMLQSMYPEAVREILPYVGEVCDRMEYEGSMMFDEHPDKNTVRRLSDEICGQTGDIWPREPVQEPDGVMSMQYQGGGRGPLRELTQILLLQEMHHRRCRHRRCRPHMF